MTSRNLIRYILISLFIGAFISPVTIAQISSESKPEAGSTTVKRPEAITSIDSRIKSENFDRVWQMTGPFGGDVMALAIDPRDADRILIGTSDGQIYRSADGGTVWKRIRPGIKAAGFTITVILFDREKPGAIYAGVKPLVDLSEDTGGGGLFLSEDDGESWRALEGMNGRAVRGLVQSSKDADVLVAAARNGIYRSMDRGKAWERVTPANDPELTGFHTVAIDPRDVNIIYVGTHHLPWKTTNGGQTWKRAGSKETGMIDDSDIMAIHIDESNPDVVLMSACSGIYRSTDGCAKWAKIQGIPYSSRRTHVIYQHPTRPEVNFAGTTEGLWISTGNGKADSWRRVTSLRLVINAIAVHPAKPDRVFLGTEDNGVLISNDGGESYEASNAGFINRQVRAVLADRTERGRVYAGVIFDGASSGLFVSEDGGLTWQQSMTGMGVRDVYSIHQSSSNPDTIYAGTNGGLYRSDDKGRNWTQVKKEEKVEAPVEEKKSREDAIPPPLESTQPKPLNIRPRRVRPEAPGKIVKPIVQTRAAAKPQGKSRAKTRRKASTKKPKPAAPPKPVSDKIDLERHIFSLLAFTPRLGEAADPSVPVSDWLIASTWDGLFYSEDEKKGWKPLKVRRPGEFDTMLPVQPRINTIATSPHAPGVIFIGAEDGLYVSRDNGENFKLTSLDEDATRVRAIVFDPRTVETIHVGTSTGFFRSLDGGQTWERRGGGMPFSVDVAAIALGGNPDELYLSDDLRGTLYHSKDRGRNWERLDISQLPSLKSWTLASDPFDTYRLYVGSFSGGVYVMTRK
jgi:photosystem II stability/assembly factor-like uncharacterized protein